jgi:hypothetical protein
MSSTIWTVRTAKLIDDKHAASVVVRLMMALNDMEMADEGLREWTTTQDRRKLFRQGGRIYYLRMRMGHVYEALFIIKEIQNGPELKAIVQACDPMTRSSFDEVATFLTTADYKSCSASGTTSHSTTTASSLCGHLSRLTRSLRTMSPAIRSGLTRLICISSLATS